MTSSDVAVEEYLLPYGTILPRKSLVNDKYQEHFDNYKGDAYINKIIPSGRPIPYGPKWGQAAEFIISSIQSATMDNKPIDDIINDLESDLSNIYNW